jgi:tetratricopeptide (TPR) repeat protein
MSSVEVPSSHACKPPTTAVAGSGLRRCGEDDDCGEESAQHRTRLAENGFFPGQSTGVVVTDGVRRCLMRLWTSMAILALASAAVTMAADDLEPVKADAVRQYDEGNYSAALDTLHNLDLARALDGPLLYRLFFCEKTAGHEDEARKALERARQSLETEFDNGKSLEGAFYLANTYSNLGRAADARNVAQAATADIEAKRIAAPKSAIGLFQLGKLYQDQSRPSEAASYYAKAVDAFDLKSGRYAGNARWALRFLGTDAVSRSDYASAETTFGRLTSLGGADAADWNALALARVKLGKYGPAAEAWRTLVKIDPANADDPRYAARLADTAATLGPLPLAAAGTPFATMPQADLETTMKSRAETAMAAQAAVSEARKAGAGGTEKGLDPKQRAEMEQSLRQARREFVAAGLEYVGGIFRSGRPRFARATPCSSSRIARGSCRPRRNPKARLPPSPPDHRASARSPSNGILKRSPSSARTKHKKTRSSNPRAVSPAAPPKSAPNRGHSFGRRSR